VGGSGVSSLNTLTGDLNLVAGSDITITPSGGDTLTIATDARPLTVAELDGSPSVANVTTIKFDNGTVTNVGGGVVSVTNSASGYVPTSRTISTTAPLTGGGDLSADRTFALTTSPAGQTPVGVTRSISTTLPLRIDAGASADLSANRTLTINDFTGDSGLGGLKGTVPAPAAGDAAANKFLKADATWATASSSTTPVIGERPTGTINGFNATFTLAHTPVVFRELRRNRAPMTDQSSRDYTRSGATITYVAGNIPIGNDDHEADYDW
jgi:hypothetical protein